MRGTESAYRPSPQTWPSRLCLADHTLSGLPCRYPQTSATATLVAGGTPRTLAGTAPRGCRPVAVRNRTYNSAGQGRGRGLSTPALVLAPEPAHWERLRNLVVDSVSSVHSRRAYAFALDEFFAWYRAGARLTFSKALVQEYRAHLEELPLAPSTINVRLAAIRKLASEAADNGLLAPELAAGIAKVKGAKQSGVRAGKWLDQTQARDLLRAPAGKGLKPTRDRAMLGLLLGCALRRGELVSLRVEHMQERAGRWLLPDLVGKGNRVRTVPVPAWVKELLDVWLAVAGIVTGPLFRPLSKAGLVGEKALTENSIWWIVRESAGGLELGNLAPHDLRRTCARLCRESGGALEEIQLLLGHGSIQTTMDYLGTRQNLAEAVNDRLGLID
jgi:integrase/recombinase XerD